VLRGGSAGPVLLLLHGLGATADVWRGVIGELGTARWVAPDLPGHGRSAALPAYTFEGVADAVAELVDPGGTVVVGHSFGGVVGLHLAGRPGVSAVIGLGIKSDWTGDELARAAAFAAKDPAVFPTRAAAVARHLRVAGLDGLVDPDDPAVEAGVRPAGDGWRTALDPRAFGVGEPHVAALVAKSPVPTLLARGEHDRMVPAAGVDLPGLGHNAHVEDPAAVVALIGGHTRISLR